MAKNKFNVPLKLINPKPSTQQMTDNGYGFYVYPIPVIKYANKVLTGNEMKLYLAIAGQAGQKKNGEPCCWAISHYCDIAHIGVTHYDRALTGLCQKGFIIHKKFESIEVLYPISEEEYITPTGRIQKKAISQSGKYQQLKSSPNSNEKNDFGKISSQNCANNNINKDINNITKSNKITKTQRSKLPMIYKREYHYLKELVWFLCHIYEDYNNKKRLNAQVRELKSKGFSYEFIYYAIEEQVKSECDGRITYDYYGLFEEGLNLLFTTCYQEQILDKMEKIHKKEIEDFKNERKKGIKESALNEKLKKERIVQIDNIKTIEEVEEIRTNEKLKEIEQKKLAEEFEKFWNFK